MQRNGLEWLVGPQIASFPWLIHAFSTRRGGVSPPPAAGLNLGDVSGNPPTTFLKNRRMFFEALGAKPFSLASIRQVHSAEIFEVKKSPKLRFLPSGYEQKPGIHRGRPSGDAMLTRAAGVLLSIRTADCLPILVADPESRVVAAIHSGWRGALKRITEKTIGEMRRLYGSKPRRMFAALGPCIRTCCYEVGEEVVDNFTGHFVNSAKYFSKVTNSGAEKRGFPGMPFLSMMPPGHERPAGSGLCLDLVAIARDQLCSAGLPSSHIQTSEFCTSCRTDLFFSYRKEGNATGRMMAVIGIRR